MIDFQILNVTENYNHLVVIKTPSYGGKGSFVKLLNGYRIRQISSYSGLLSAFVSVTVGSHALDLELTADGKRYLKAVTFQVKNTTKP